MRRTTVAAPSDDLDLLEGEAQRRGVSLTQVLREAVQAEAERLRGERMPRFGVFRGDGTSTTQIAEGEDAPARHSGRS
ncbi:MAG: ribbon-helix-helix protein, CopG family [Solirubrobacterales bacterium]